MDHHNRPVPALFESKTTYVAHSFNTGVAFVTPELASRAGAPIGPALVFELTVRHEGRLQEMRLLFPLTTPADVAALKRHVDTSTEFIAKSFDDPNLFAVDVALVEDLNRRAGFIPDTRPPVHCPGCGARLFGKIADRGACLGCFPKVTEDDAVAVEGGE